MDDKVEITKKLLREGIERRKMEVGELKAELETIRAQLEERISGLEAEIKKAESALSAIYKLETKSEIPKHSEEPVQSKKTAKKALELDVSLDTRPRPFGIKTTGKREKPNTGIENQCEIFVEKYLKDNQFITRMQVKDEVPGASFSNASHACERLIRTHPKKYGRGKFVYKKRILKGIYTIENPPVELKE